MDHFRFTRRTQPMSKIGLYKTCKRCFHFKKKGEYIDSYKMCQKCSIEHDRAHYFFILQQLSNVPGLTHIYRRILFKYL